MLKWMIQSVSSKTGEDEGKLEVAAMFRKDFKEMWDLICS